MRELSGVTIPNVLLRVVDPNAELAAKGRRRRSSLPPGVLIERRGSLLFTHLGLSGPVVLDVSRAVTASTNPCDTETVGRLCARLQARRNSKNDFGPRQLAMAGGRL